ncbi:hypothetical protein N7U66_19170 [Lacinutrix neustonica]|uniref:Uncharacterized protein n=1 Tax=Lacinutrix neustonica TaxID=2980107 RepID=A0A9E8SD10_9FLAO|nr:hypothetical protein [Lacinutrix neustonica]WAC01938.1 hypothetical protein N7U66_19170 [Lacinutrix neustonica]
MALLKAKKHEALKPFNTYIIQQYKKHLKALLYANNNFSKTILKRLVIKQLSLFRIVDAVKTFAIVGFYLSFKKGHFLLKKL